MKNNVLIHIPHSSLKLPDFFYENLIISKEELEKENLFLCDYLIDKFIPKECENIIKFDYSRMFCDVERFKDDNLESMSKYGMGALYQKDHNGRVFINYHNKYKQMVIKNYYDLHHELLDTKVSDILNKYDKCYIIDLHSFSENFVKKILNKENCPDICIGFNEIFCDEILINKTKEYFEKCGYSVKFNYPYSGSIIPNKYYNSDESNIFSIMIEINKKTYLNKDNITINNDKFSKKSKRWRIFSPPLSFSCGYVFFCIYATSRIFSGNLIAEIT